MSVGVGTGVSVGVGGTWASVGEGGTEAGVGVWGAEVGVGVEGTKVGVGVNSRVDAGPEVPHPATASATTARTARGSKTFNLMPSLPSASVPNIYYDGSGGRKVPGPITKLKPK